MLSAWWLLLIVPSAASLGFVAFAAFATGGRQSTNAPARVVRFRGGRGKGSHGGIVFPRSPREIA